MIRRKRFTWMPGEYTVTKAKRPLDLKKAKILHLRQLAKGDVAGHPFHGNQYTGGIGDSYLPKSMADVKKMKRVTGLPLGSQGGQWYEDKQGNKFLVKPAKDLKHAYNEYMTGEVYRQAGAAAPHTAVLQDGNKAYVVSQMIPNLETHGENWWTSDASDTTRQLAQQDWGLDVLLANYDTVGLEWDNLLTNQDGDPFRIDNGGAGAYRAMGGPKLSWNDPEGVSKDFDSMRGQTFNNPQMKAVFGDISDSEGTKLVQSAAERIDTGALSDAFDKAGVPSAQGQDFLSHLDSRIQQAQSLGMAKTESYVDRLVKQLNVNKDAKEHGIMVAVVPPPAALKVLAQYGPDEKDNLHMTLVYLGKIGALKEGQEEQITKVVEDFASKQPPLAGKIQGVGRFNATDSSDGKDVFWAHADVPGLPEFRQQLVDALKAAGLPVAENHGFTPHITLAYIEPGADLPHDSIPTLPLPVDELLCKIGDKSQTFPLGGRKISTLKKRIQQLQSIVQIRKEEVYAKGKMPDFSTDAGAQPTLVFDLNRTITPSPGFPLSEAPYDGAVEYINELAARNVIIIVATAGLHPYHPPDVLGPRRDQAEAYFKQYGIPVRVLTGKVSARVYLDDRMVPVPPNNNPWPAVVKGIEKQLDMRAEKGKDGLWKLVKRPDIGTPIEEFPTDAEVPPDQPRGWNKAVLDFDLHRCILQSNSSDNTSGPRPGAVEVINYFYDEGYTIHPSCQGWDPATHTPRVSEQKAASLRLQLRKAGIKYDSLVSKIHGTVFVDDKGIAFTTWPQAKIEVLKVIRTLDPDERDPVIWAPSK